MKADVKRKKKTRGGHLYTGKKKKEQLLSPGSTATDHHPSHPRSTTIQATPGRPPPAPPRAYAIAIVFNHRFRHQVRSPRRCACTISLHFTVQVKYNSLVTVLVHSNPVTVLVHSNQSMLVLGWNPSPAHAAGLSPAL